VNSVILGSATRLLIPVLVLFSLFLLVRGHDLPGGGFLGGLMAASAIALHAIANGLDAAKRLVRVAPRHLMAFGLILAVAAGLWAPLVGRPFLTGLWWIIPIGERTLKLSTPLVFDVGVYLVVIGMFLAMLFALEER
jgi:multicomponent Na+:H+ antiporter subunit B